VQSARGEISHAYQDNEEACEEDSGQEDGEERRVEEDCKEVILILP
jgi:hypothetical protein